MKTFNEFHLVEAFDSGADVRWVKQTPNTWEGYATIQGHEFVFAFGRSGENDWEFAFGDENSNTDLTGTKGGKVAMGVVATALKAMRVFDKAVQPEMINFTAANKEKSRVKLYKRMVDRFAKEHGFKVYTSGENGYETLFQLDRL